MNHRRKYVALVKTINKKKHKPTILVVIMQNATQTVQAPQRPQAVPEVTAVPIATRPWRFVLEWAGSGTDIRQATIEVPFNTSHLQSARFLQQEVSKLINAKHSMQVRLFLNQDGPELTPSPLCSDYTTCTSAAAKKELPTGSMKHRWQPSASTLKAWKLLREAPRTKATKKNRKACTQESQESQVAHVLSVGLYPEYDLFAGMILWHWRPTAQQRLRLCNDLVKVCDPAYRASISWFDQKLTRDMLAHQCIVMAVLKRCQGQCVRVMRQASESLRANLIVVEQAVSSDELVLDCVSPALQSNLRVVLKAVKNCPSSLQYASPELQDTTEVVEACVRKDGMCLVWASERLRGSAEVVQKAVKQNGMALQYASDALKACRATVLEAVSQCGGAIQFAVQHLRDDKEIFKRALASAKSQVVLLYTSPDSQLRSDKEIVKAVAANAWHDFEFASDVLKDDTDLVSEVVRSQGVALQFASDRLRNDANVVELALQQSMSAFSFAGPSLTNNSNFVLNTLRKCLSLPTNNLNTCVELVLQCASLELKSSPLFIIAACSVHRLAMNYISNELSEASSQFKLDPMFVLTAAKRFGWSRDLENLADASCRYHAGNK